jgi:phage terminase large subunit
VPAKLEPFLSKKKRYKVAYGGRGAAKSMTIADILAYKSWTEDALVGCIREYQNSLEDSVYSLMKTEIGRLKLPGFKILKNRIDRLGKTAKGGMRFKGLSRSIDAIKSTFGFNYFWLEEGQFMSEDSLRMLTPTLRESGSELWISANPVSSADPFSQRFILPYQKEIDKKGYFEDEMHYIVKVNYYDNPWFPEVLEQERQNDLKIMPRASYDHVWLGEFNDSVEDSIIKAEWFDAAVDAHIKLGFKPRGAVVAAHDPSDLGTDDKGFCLRHGSVILEAEARSFGEVNDGCDWALDKAIEAGADVFSWDCDGMGVALKKQVVDSLKGKKVEICMFKGSEKPWQPLKVYEPALPTSKLQQKEKTNRETFKNRRAQFYWMVRDRFYKTYLAIDKGVYVDPDEMLSISSGIKDLKQLRSEICRIPRKYNASGLLQVMSKPEMRTNKIQSPNIADSVMMSLVIPEMAESGGDIVFDTVF